MDGNKRVGYYLARAILLHFGLNIKASENEKYDFVIAVAEGRFEIESIEEWFVKQTAKV